MRSLHPGLATVALLLTDMAAASPPGTRAADRPAAPRLLVLVVFDQMRGDYLLRWHDLFGPDGFRRLEREGTLFTHCYYPYAGTITGPGHASLLTGCSPDRHGVVTNDWLDRAAGGMVYCTGAERYADVYTTPPPSGGRKGKGSATPERLLAPTVADALKDATGGRAKVVGLSLKDRSAILPTGQKPNACYWFDAPSGQFITSTYYRDTAHAWVAEYNRSGAADRWFGRAWTRLRDDLDYVRHAGPDDAPGESTGALRRQGKVFPHPMNAGLSKPGREYYETLEASPFGNDLILDVAVRAIEAEQLGRDDVPDLLALSFSSNDIIGHGYGPDSQEVLDVTLRSDHTVRDLLAALDRAVGVGRYALALSADHGVCPLPERAVREGHDARRVEPKVVRGGMLDFLNQAFGTAEVRSAWIEAEAGPWIYLNHKLLAARQLAPADVASALAGWLRSQPYVQAAYTRQELDGDPARLDETGRLMKKSYHPDRCGDLAIVPKPYCLVSNYPSGTNHGTPHEYDRHVPLVLLGPGVPPGRSDEAVTPQAIAAAFAHMLGAPPPARAEAPVPRRLRPE
jgi:hypothetical protein